MALKYWKPRSVSQPISFFHLSPTFQSKPVEMAGDKETLLAMGFDPPRVECAS